MTLFEDDVIQIYEDPLTQRTLEGVALVVKCHDVNELNSEYGLLTVDVRFENETQVVRRKRLVTLLPGAGWVLANSGLEVL